MRALVSCTAILGLLAVAGLSGASPKAVWSERMAGPLDWASPSKHTAAEINAVFSLETRDGARVLHARHDARPGTKGPSPVHYGHAFAKAPRLADACHLSFRWRVNQHPAVGADAWSDLGASVYVITRVPGVFSKGRGLKLGWTAKSAPTGTFQHGILQVPIRSGAAGGLVQEHVDLCAAYRAQWGDPADERIQYIGVVTDADGSKSVAEADYTDFVLEP